MKLGLGILALAVLTAPAAAQETSLAAFCKAPELAVGVIDPGISGLRRDALEAERLTLEAKAAMNRAAAGPYDPQARGVAIRQRDEAALAWWRIDMACKLGVTPDQLNSARSKAWDARSRAGVMRTLAQEEYDRYATVRDAVDAGAAPRSELDKAFQSLKTAQERMWDAREVQDQFDLENRRASALRNAINRFTRLSPDMESKLVLRNQLTVAVDNLRALRSAADFDRTEEARLLRRMDLLRSESLTFDPRLPVSLASAPGQLAAIGGTDWQAKRPAVLPVLPPSR